MDGKKGFVLYCDLIHTVNKLPDEKAGKLFKIILAYVNDENPKPDELLLDLAFEPIKRQLKRDLKKWEEQRQQRVEAGRKGGLTRARNARESQAELSKTKQGQANQAVIVNDTVTVNDNVNDKDINKNRRFKKPTLDQIKSYITENNYNVDAERFLNYYDSNGWKVGRNSMKDWKATIRSWNSKNKDEAVSEFPNKPDNNYEYKIKDDPEKIMKYHQHLYKLGWKRERVGIHDKWVKV